MIASRAQALSAFDRLLARASTGGVPPDGYVVESFDNSEGLIYLGCSVTGELAFLVASKPSRTPPPPLRLAGLSADFGVRCLLSDGASERLVRLSALKCTDIEGSIRDLFATVCSALAGCLPAAPTEQEFSGEITRWSSLFWRLGQRVATDIVGLAGELVVLRQARDVDRWVQAWHSKPNDILDFDFLESRVGVEVKTTRGSAREHPISLAQVLEPGLANRYFASVQIDMNDSGELLGDLVRELSDRLKTGSSRLMLWSVLTKSCGEGLEEVLSRRIDVSKAALSLRFYRAVDIPVPSVKLPLPSGVSSVKFTSNLDLADEATVADVESSIG